MRGEPMRREGSPFVSLALRWCCLERGCHQAHPRWRVDLDLPFAAAFGEAAHGPFQQVVSRGASGELQTWQLVEVGEPREIEVVVLGIKTAGRSGLLFAERRDRIGELRIAAKRLRASLRYLESALGPVQRAVQILEPVGIHSGDVAGERALQ